MSHTDDVCLVTLQQSYFETNFPRLDFISTSKLIYGVERERISYTQQSNLVLAIRCDDVSC